MYVHSTPARDRDETREAPHEGEHRPYVDTHRERRLLIVRHALERDALAGPGEEPADGADEHEGDPRRRDLVGRHEHPAHVHGAARQGEVEVPGHSGEQERGERAQHRAESDGDHDHPDDRPPDEVAQHEPVESGCDHEHPRAAERQGGCEGEAHRVRSGGHETGGEHHEFAEREVHDPGRLVDHYEGERGERIESARDGAVHAQLQEIPHPRPPSRTAGDDTEPSGSEQENTARLPAHALRRMSQLSCRRSRIQVIFIYNQYIV